MSQFNPNRTFPDFCTKAMDYQIQRQSGPAPRPGLALSSTWVPESGKGRTMRKLYAFVWRTSASQQIVLIIVAIVAAVLATAPLELQRHIINTLAGHEKAERLAVLCGGYLIAALAIGSAGRPVQPPYSRLCQSARHSCDRLLAGADGLR